MSPKKTAALLVVLALLCGGYWLMLRTEKQRSRQAEESKRLFSVRAEDFASLDVTRLGEPSIAGTRRPGMEWVLSAPYQAVEANQVVWDRAAKALAELRSERTLAISAADMTATGLADPALTVSGTTSGGARVKVAFGDVEPAQLYRYARVLEGGEPEIFLVKTDAFFELNRSLLDLRHRFLVKVGEQGITRLEFALFWKGGKDGDAVTPDGRQLKVGDESAVVVSERGGDGLWRLAAPVQAIANQELVEALIKEVQFATGRGYVDAPEALADYGLDPPAARITVVSGTGPRQTIFFGSLNQEKKKDGGGIYVKLDAHPAVFVIDSNIVALFPKRIDSFREDRLLTRRAAEIKELHYRTPDADIVLTNDPEKGWLMTQPARNDVDQASVSSFISALKGLRATSFPQGNPAENPGQYGLEQPKIAVSLVVAQEAQPSEIRIGGAVPDAQYYYAVQDTGALAMVPFSLVEEIRWGVLDFCSRQLMRFSPRDLSRISLYLEGMDYLFESVRGTWVLRVPAGAVLDSQGDMDLLIAAINPVVASRVEAEPAPKDLSPYGLDKPMCQLTVTAASFGVPAAGPGSASPEGTVYGPLSIGNTADDDSRSRFAILGGSSQVVRVKQEVIDGIRQALRGVRVRGEIAPAPSP